MDVVGAVASEDLGGVDVEACEGVRPDVGRCAHQAFVCCSVELLKLASQHLHPVAVVEAGEARESELPWGGEMVDGSAARGEVELLGIEVNVAEVLARVVTPGG